MQFARLGIRAQFGKLRYNSVVWQIALQDYGDIMKKFWQLFWQQKKDEVKRSFGEIINFKLRNTRITWGIVILFYGILFQVFNENVGTIVILFIIIAIIIYIIVLNIRIVKRKIKECSQSLN